MSKLFNFFPKTFYSNNDVGNSLDTVTNITARFGFETKLKENTAAFYRYEIQDGDTPEIIAHKYYGHVERHWIVLMFNDIIDPQFDWPLEERNLMDFIELKYSSPEFSDKANTGETGLSYAKSSFDPHTWYKIVTRVNDLDGEKLIEKIDIDQQTYTNLPSSTIITYTLQNGQSVTETTTKLLQTRYEYEVENNEEKRSINLLRSDFVSQIEAEFKRVIKGK